MAPSTPRPSIDGLASTSSTQATLIVSLSVIVSSVLGSSGIILVIILVIVTRRRTLKARFLQELERKREAIPKLIVTDTSLFPYQVVVVDDENTLDTLIASYKPLHLDSSDGGEVDVFTYTATDRSDKDKKREIANYAVSRIFFPLGSLSIQHVTENDVPHTITSFSGEYQTISGMRDSVDVCNTFSTSAHCDNR